VIGVTGVFGLDIIKEIYTLGVAIGYSISTPGALQSFGILGGI